MIDPEPQRIPVAFRTSLTIRSTDSARKNLQFSGNCHRANGLPLSSGSIFEFIGLRK